MRAYKKVALLVLLTVVNYGAKKNPKELSYEQKLKKAESALREKKIFEAATWAEEALKIRPQSLEAQKVMARALDEEVAEEKKFSQSPIQPPEELKSDEKKLQIKTLLERSRTLLDMNLLKEANDTAEEALQLDPENLEASHLIDSVKDKAQKHGREESLFLQQLYGEEIDSRIEKYTQQADAWVAKKKMGGRAVGG